MFLNFIWIMKYFIDRLFYWLNKLNLIINCKFIYVLYVLVDNNRLFY